MAAKREKIHFASVEELLGAPATTGEGTVEMKIDNSLVFTYNENGGMSDDRPYVRISDEILSPEEIADVWVNNK